MTNTLEEVGKFYKNYSKLASFSTKIRNTIRKGDEVRRSLANVCIDNLCKQPLSYRCDHPLDWLMYLWKANLGGLTTISLLAFNR
ncbi:hypothetical protein Ahy_B02g059793 [Arachis hypogaea]|uniref:Uncharacterized protein n=1 Tax=Arachis hypogaea TaxID=3818 RepID=A0A445AHD5_ARAHY|nr:hypothetical protein Ahy_B02g059793 [Arachis hypogaea]